MRAQEPAAPAGPVRLRDLVGSGDRIGLFVLPILVGGLLLNMAFPDVFSVGGPPPWLRVLSLAVVAVGLVVWAWSVVLILTKVRAGQLVTTGPFALVKHPLYTSVALLVLPWLGFLLGSWLGVVVGIALYGASRLFAPAGEADLANRFGTDWDAYRRKVILGWL